MRVPEEGVAEAGQEIVKLAGGPEDRAGWSAAR